MAEPSAARRAPRALVALALLTLVSVVGVFLWSIFAAQAGHPAPVCTTPVEVIEPHGVRLGCASESGLAGCGVLAPGDRAVLTSPACSIVSDGMGAAMRLLVGLPLNLNTSTSADLQLLEGVGPALANAIVEHRRVHGPFRSVDDLDAVRGVGAKTLARLRPLLVVRAGPER